MAILRQQMPRQVDSELHVVSREVKPRSLFDAFDLLRYSIS